VSTKVNWVKYLKFSEGSDEPCTTCLFGDYVAVLGAVGLFHEGRASVVLLDRNTGEIVKMWRSEASVLSNPLHDCLSVGNMLYVVGSIDEAGVVYIFDEDLHVLKKIKGSSHTLFSSIACDGKYLYVGGMFSEGRVTSWYIEKRTLDLELIKSKKLCGRDWFFSSISKIAVNPFSGEVWTVGSYDTEGGEEYSFIVIFNKELNDVNKIEYPKGHEYYLGHPCGICFDDAGNAYVAGWEGVIKLGIYGNILAVNKKVNVSSIVRVGNFMYAFGDIMVDSYQRHILYILDSKLEVVERNVLSKSVEATSIFPCGRPSYDGQSIYIAGYDYAFGKDKERWVVYSILVPTEKVTRLYM